MTNREAFKCDKCKLMKKGVDKRFPYCTHKIVGQRSIHKLARCPKTSKV